MLHVIEGGRSIKGGRSLAVLPVDPLTALLIKTYLAAVLCAVLVLAWIFGA